MEATIMKRLLAFTLILSCLSFAIAAVPKVAVLDITAQKDMDQSVVAPITETIMGEIVASKAYTVLDRAYIDQVLKEKEFQLSGAVSDQQVVQAGQYLGADYVVAGKALMVSGAYFLVAKMIDVKTGAITAQSSEQAEGKALVLLDMARTVGRALAAGGSAPESAAAPAPATTAMTQARAATPATAPSTGRVKAGFVIEFDGTFGGGPPWRLEAARRDLQDRCGAWLDTVAAYKAEGDHFQPSIDRLVGKEGCSIVFTYGGDFKRLAEAAAKYPKVIFVGNNIPWFGGMEKLPNLRAYGNEDSGPYYVMGMIAGALSKTGKLACMSMVDRSWLRMVDYFALGVKATNPKAVVYLKAYRQWDPNQGEKDAKALVAQGCDIFAPVLDFGNVVEYFKKTAASGKRIFTFGNDMPREAYPGVLIAGRLRDWSVALERILVPFRDGKDIPPYTVLGFRDRTSPFDGPAQSIGPMFADLLRANKIKTPDMGEVPAFDFVMRRIDQMYKGEFEPFTGPIADQKGILRLMPGEGPDINLWNTLDWLVDNVKGDFPKL
jgi:basic membrane protein A and related proteins